MHTSIFHSLHVIYSSNDHHLKFVYFYLWPHIKIIIAKKVGRLKRTKKWFLFRGSYDLRGLLQFISKLSSLNICLFRRTVFSFQFLSFYSDATLRKKKCITKYCELFSSTKIIKSVSCNKVFFIEIKHFLKGYCLLSWSAVAS